MPAKTNVTSVHITSIAVINPTNKNMILLGKRKREGTYKGLYNTPGGGIEETDTNALEAAKRELYEETGVQTNNLVHACLLIDDTFTSFIYILQAKDEVFHNTEPETTEPWEWIDIRRNDIQCTPVTRRVIEFLLNGS